VIRSNVASFVPAGYRFPREVTAAAVRWYLRYGLSYRDVEELPAERGVEVDHVTTYRWVQTFTPPFIDAARPARRRAGDRWFLDETYDRRRIGSDLVCRGAWRPAAGPGWFAGGMAEVVKALVLFRSTAQILVDFPAFPVGAE
jgi:hypothetical protein